MLLNEFRERRADHFDDLAFVWRLRLFTDEANWIRRGFAHGNWLLNKRTLALLVDSTSGSGGSLNPHGD
jgi:hypothetical protein